MLLGIFGWFLTNPLGQKIGIIAICIAVSLGALWAYGKHRYNAGKDEGIKVGIARIEEQKREEWAKTEEGLKIKATELAEKSLSLDKEGSYIERMRTGLVSTLAEIRAKSQASQESANAIVSSIPGDQLDDAIRALSARLGAPTAAQPPK